MTTATTSKRTQAREVTLQLLFQRDLNPGVGREDITRFVSDQLSDSALVSLALTLYDLTIADPTIDTRISQSADNWRLTRMAVIDRNILRMAAGELIHYPETPPNVVFDEAIELAKRFGATDSSAFINGVLDRLHKEWLREQATPAEQPTSPPGDEASEMTEPTPQVEVEVEKVDAVPTNEETGELGTEAPGVSSRGEPGT